MRAPDRIGPWEILDELPGEAEVRRWRARHTETGDTAEVLALRNPSPRADTAFATTHRSLSHQVEPGLARTLLVDQSWRQALVVRQELGPTTLADARPPLPPAQVAALGAHLLPAVVAAGSATQGALRPEDVGLSPQGTPLLAPRGRPHARISKGDALWVAPEAFDGVAPSGSSGLYGLGVLLYRLATGRDPRFTPGLRAPPPPPPSSLRPGIPSALDQAILRLMDPDPVQRAGAMPLLQDLAGALPDLMSEPPVRAAPDLTGEVRYTITAPTRSRGVADAATFRAATVVPAEAVLSLSPSTLSHLAGQVELPLSEVEDLARKGLPLVVSTAPRLATAREQAEALVAQGLPVEVAGGSGAALKSMALVLLSSGAVLTVLGVLAAVLPILVGALVPGVVAGGVLGLLAIVAFVLGGMAWSRGRARTRGLLEARQAQDASRSRQQMVRQGRAARAWERVATLRRQLPSLELPAAAEADLRSGLKEVESQLLTISRRLENIHKTLDQADLDQLRTRLASLSQRATTDSESAAQRDRLGRTVTDLEALVQQRDRLDGQVVHIEDALDEMTATLGHHHAGDEVDSSAIDQLVQSTRLARQTLDQLEQDELRPPPVSETAR